jgi:hypothetical protein
MGLFCTVVAAVIVGGAILNALSSGRDEEARDEVERLRERVEEMETAHEELKEAHEERLEELQTAAEQAEEERLEAAQEAEEERAQAEADLQEALEGVAAAKEFLITEEEEPGSYASSDWSGDFESMRAQWTVSSVGSDDWESADYDLRRTHSDAWEMRCTRIRKKRDGVIAEREPESRDWKSVGQPLAEDLEDAFQEYQDAVSELSRIRSGR